MTQMEQARLGIITHQMRQAAEYENLDPEFIRKGVAEGTIVVPANINHKNLKARAIGKGTKTKINTNFGMSKDKDCKEYELQKLELSLSMNSDTVMDLSIGGDINGLLTMVIDKSYVAVGTVPAYQIISEKGIFFTVEELFASIENQAQLGVDYMTLHCGVNRSSLELLDSSERIMNCVSRGGGVMLNWMRKTGNENPLFEFYDRLLDIAYKYDVTLSLGDGFRPGSIHDATDKHQIHELRVLGELTKKAWERNVQVMIEGPGHVPMDQIAANMQLQKTLCHNAPFYVLGPLVTDIGVGYDHITAAIGGAIAAWHGADMLCYVTPAEHLRLPSLLDVREGIAAAKIAAHAGDLAKGVTSFEEKDNQMSRARKGYDWLKQREFAFDTIKFDKYQKDGESGDKTQCTMCGEFCPMKN
ncbi:MAG: phosphomethylpyrimidine synthase ThiC [Candidatus Delongbacteria bacterium]|nr:phosphomethylpyrimidine synthase ThiC [Candidatus Delongbacteria bacterium]MBN2836993.1 phosphomethylpyrimidine synthase ThiC [Candidatus Delongbacteria bacterium]